MKRLIISGIMILLCAATPLMAQEKKKKAALLPAAKKTDHTITFLPEIGLNISGASAKKPDTKFSGTPLPGIQFGMRAEIPIVQMISFRPGLVFSYESTQKDVYGDKTKFHVFFLKIPMDFTYQITPRIYAGFGPYIGVALTGKYKWRDEKRSIEWGKDENTDDLKRLDAGIRFSGGYAFTPKIGFGASLDLGVRDISAQPNVKIHTMSFAVTACYRLGK